MIVTVGKTVGKRLDRAIIDEIKTQGYSEVAAISDLGAQRIANAGQRVSNALKRKIEATSKAIEVDFENGTKRLALVVRLNVKGA